MGWGPADRERGPAPRITTRRPGRGRRRSGVAAAALPRRGPGVREGRPLRQRASPRREVVGRVSPPEGVGPHRKRSARPARPGPTRPHPGPRALWSSRRVGAGPRRQSRGAGERPDLRLRVGRGRLGRSPRPPPARGRDLPLPGRSRRGPRGVKQGPGAAAPRVGGRGNGRGPTEIRNSWALPPPPHPSPSIQKRKLKMFLKNF